MPKRILLIDDDLPLARSTAMLLRNAGHETSVALDGISGLAMASGFCPNLIILDIGMPDINGFEVQRRLQQTAATARIPVVFFSANSAGASRRRALAAGARAFVSKPYQAKGLLDAVESALKTEEAGVA